MNNRILVISFYTYPCKLVGAKRISYFVNYLVKQGVNITLIRSDNESIDFQTDDRLALDPEINVIEIGNLRKRNTHVQTIHRFLKFYKAIHDILIEDKFDFMYFSGGPFFYFPLGIIFKFKNKIPYILDFRDLWVVGVRKILNWKGRLLLKIERLFEKESIKHADLIISVSSKINELFKEKYEHKKKLNILTILNGYNDKELPEIDRNYRNKRELVKIGIFGKFSYYNSGHLQILIEAIRAIKSSVNIQIHHISIFEEDFMQTVSMNNLNENFIFTGFKNYSEGIKYLYDMDFLILNNRTKYALGTKIFDYLYLNKPIMIFMTADSEIWKLLSDFSNTYLIQNSEDMIIAIKELLNSNDWNVIDRKMLQTYSRKYQTEKLYKYFINSGLLKADN